MINLGAFLVVAMILFTKKQNPRRRRARRPLLRRSNPPVGVIPGHVERILYQREGMTKHPGPYQHTFGRGAKMIAMKNGDIVIRSSRGKRLWGRY